MDDVRYIHNLGKRIEQCRTAEDFKSAIEAVELAFSRQEKKGCQRERNLMRREKDLAQREKQIAAREKAFRGLEQPSEQEIKVREERLVEMNIIMKGANEGLDRMNAKLRGMLQNLSIVRSDVDESSDSIAQDKVEEVLDSMAEKELFGRLNRANNKFESLYLSHARAKGETDEDAKQRLKKIPTDPSAAKKLEADLGAEGMVLYSEQLVEAAERDPIIRRLLRL